MGMHHEGMKELSGVDLCSRWKPIVALFDFLVLRCGSVVGVALAGGVEASSRAFFTSMRLPFVRDYPSNLVLFHFFEEFEHGSVTVHILRGKTNVLMRALSIPPMCVLWVVFLMSPPLLHALAHPWVLVRPSTYLQMVLYYLNFTPAVIDAWGCLVWHWLLPFPEGVPDSTTRYVYCKDLVDARGIKFDVKGEEMFMID